MDRVSQLLTEVLIPAPVTAGSIAHKRTPAVLADGDKRPFDGTPTSARPACGADMGGAVVREMSLGRADQLGAKYCPTCFGGGNG